MNKGIKYYAVTQFMQLMRIDKYHIIGKVGS